MPHIITREWRGYPATIQLADGRVYSKQEQAEEELEELYREFPSRVFRIREANGPIPSPSNTVSSWQCPECNYVATVDATMLAEIGTPHCPNCDRELLQLDRES